MTVLLQVSDSHFGTERASVADALTAWARGQRPDLVVLSGDITQRARPAQFQAARAFVDRLGSPVLAVPGNHDIPLFDLWTRVSRPYSRFAAVFGDVLEPVHRGPDLMVVGVNTTRAWRHKHGEVSSHQVDRVAGVLAGASPGQLRIVVVHQPVAVTRDEDRPNLLRGREAALQRWAIAGADVVMGGHIHLPYVLGLPGLARAVWAVQAGTSVSTRTRTGVPNSVNLLRWGRDSTPGVCRVEQWDHSPGLQTFTLARATDIRPDGPRTP